MAIPDLDPADSTSLGFEEFFEREVAGQVQRARLLVGSADAANEIVQEALTRVFGRWEEIVEPGPYLNRVVLNLCRDHARASQRRIGLMERLRPESRPVGLDETELLDDLLEGLPFNQRAAVVLKFWRGLSHAEIAAELGCPVGSVGPWISRALSVLREELS